MRDTVISAITAAARQNPNIMFLSSDFGAPALDEFRRDLPEQFVQVGIAEQQMIDYAAGLALAGKQVFCYAMAPFLTARCFEQIKCSLSTMNLPVCLIGVGAGMGYDHTSMTHLALEDIAIMRAISHMEIFTPSDNATATAQIAQVLEQPRLSYLRLDRRKLDSSIMLQPELALRDAVRKGFRIFRPGGPVMAIACGAMVSKALSVASLFPRVAICDLLRVKPLPDAGLWHTIQKFGIKAIVTLEEQLLEGGMGAAVIEGLLPFYQPLDFSMIRVGIKDGYTLVNGGYDDLHSHFGITKGLVDALHKFSYL